MFWGAFVDDVWESVRNAQYRKRKRYPVGEPTVREVFIGETWAGAPYGAIDDRDSGPSVYLFDTELEQNAWFARMTA